MTSCRKSLGEDASNGFVAGIVAALKENIIQTMITETEKYVETGNFEKPAQSDGKSQASIQDVSQSSMRQTSVCRRQRHSD